MSFWHRSDNWERRLQARAPTRKTHEEQLADLAAARSWYEQQLSEYGPDDPETQRRALMLRQDELRLGTGPDVLCSASGERGGMMATATDVPVWMLHGEHPEGYGVFLLDVCRTREAAEARAQAVFGPKGWTGFRYEELRRRAPSQHFRPGD